MKFFAKLVFVEPEDITKSFDTNKERIEWIDEEVKKDHSKETYIEIWEEDENGNNQNPDERIIIFIEDLK